MLTIRTNIKFKSLRTFLMIGDGFGNKIRANYEMISTYFGAEELLHLLVHPAVYLAESREGDIFLNSVKKNHLVNHLLNLLMNYRPEYLTYQDTVFLQTMLQKTGIKNGREFLKQLQLSQNEIVLAQQCRRESHQSELHQSESHQRDVHQIEFHQSELRQLEHRQTSKFQVEKHNQEPIRIYEKLRIGEIYEELNLLYGAIPGAGNWLTKERYQIAEQHRIWNYLVLNQSVDVNQSEISELVPEVLLKAAANLCSVYNYQMYEENGNTASYINRITVKNNQVVEQLPDVVRRNITHRNITNSVSPPHVSLAESYVTNIQSHLAGAVYETLKNTLYYYQGNPMEEYLLYYHQDLTQKQVLPEVESALTKGVMRHVVEEDSSRIEQQRGAESSPHTVRQTGAESSLYTVRRKEDYDLLKKRFQKISMKEFFHHKATNEEIVNQDVSNQNIMNQKVTYQDTTGAENPPHTVWRKGDYDLLKRKFQKISKQELLFYQKTTNQENVNQDVANQNITNQNITNQDVTKQNITKKSITNHNVMYQDSKDEKSPPHAVRRKVAESPPHVVRRKVVESPPHVVRQKVAESPSHVVRRKIAESPPHVVWRKVAESPPHVVRRKIAESPPHVVWRKVAENPLQVSLSKSEASEKIQQRVLRNEIKKMMHRNVVHRSIAHQAILHHGNVHQSHMHQSHMHQSLMYQSLIHKSHMNQVIMHQDSMQQDIMHHDPAQHAVLNADINFVKRKTFYQNFKKQKLYYQKLYENWCRTEQTYKKLGRKIPSHAERMESPPHMRSAESVESPPHMHLLTRYSLISGSIYKHINNSLIEKNKNVAISNFRTSNREGDLPHVPPIIDFHPMRHQTNMSRSYPMFHQTNMSRSYPTSHQTNISRTYPILQQMNMSPKHQGGEVKILPQQEQLTAAQATYSYEDVIQFNQSNRNKYHSIHNQMTHDQQSESVAIIKQWEHLITNETKEIFRLASDPKHVRPMSAELFMQELQTLNQSVTMEPRNVEKSVILHKQHDAAINKKKWAELYQRSGDASSHLYQRVAEIEQHLQEINSQSEEVKAKEYDWKGQEIELESKMIQTIYKQINQISEEVIDNFEGRLRLEQQRRGY